MDTASCKTKFTGVISKLSQLAEAELSRIVYPLSQVTIPQCLSECWHAGGRGRDLAGPGGADSLVLTFFSSNKVYREGSKARNMARSKSLGPLRLPAEPMCV